MSDYATIIYEKFDNIAYITLNRPEVMNRYNIQMRDDLYQVVSALIDDTDVWVVIFKGAGVRAFCVGADLTEFGTAPSPIIARQVRWQRDVWGLIYSIRKPTIAAVHGFVFGSGLELALLCDFRIASDDAIFGLPEPSLGMIPAAGGTQTLPRVIGRSRALSMLLMGNRIDSDQALRFGLVNKVVRKDELYSSAREFAQRILSFNPFAIQCAKEAVKRGSDMCLHYGLMLESELSKKMANRAFTDK